MAKWKVLDAQTEAALRAVVRESRTRKARGRGQRPPEIPSRGWFLANIVDEGPPIPPSTDPQVDFTDNQYWIRRGAVINDKMNPQSPTTGVPIELENIEEDTNNKNNGYLWIDATHLGESSERTHDLPTDGTQQVKVEWTYDPASKQIRFFFNVRYDPSIWLGGYQLAGGSKPANGFVAIENDLSAWKAGYTSVLTPYGAWEHGEINDFCIHDSALHLAGRFPVFGGSTVACVRWNSATSRWDAVGNSVIFSGLANCIASHGGSLYLGMQAQGAGTDSIWVLSGSTWTATTNSFDFDCYDFAVYGGVLWACGWSSSGSGRPEGVASLSGSTWSQVGGEFSYGGNPSQVFCLFVDGTTAYAGGRFDDVGGTSCNNIVINTGSGWSAFGTPNDASGIIYAINKFQGSIVAGGTGTGGFVKRWNGSAWGSVGYQLLFPLTINDPTVFSLCPSPDGETLLVGGQFTKYDIDSGLGSFLLPALNIIGYAQNYAAVAIFGGVDENPPQSGIGGVARPVKRIRQITLPGETDLSIGIGGWFYWRNDAYSPSAGKLSRSRFRPAQRGVRRESGTIESVVETVVKWRGGYVLAGQFETALNRADVDPPIVEIDNAVLFKGKFKDELQDISDYVWSGVNYKGTLILGGNTFAWKWVDSTGFEALPGPTFATCYAMRQFNDLVWIGGIISLSSSTLNIVTWDGTTVVNQSIAGLNECQAFTVGDLLAGAGEQIFAGFDTPEGTGCVYARGKTGGWSEIGSPGALFGSCRGLAVVHFKIPNVTRLIAVGNPIYIGGPGGECAIAMWDGSTWTSMRDFSVVDGQIWCCYGHKWNGGEVLVGGGFRELGEAGDGAVYEARSLVSLRFDEELNDFIVDRLEDPVGRGGVSGVLKYIGNGVQ